jgi:hypothetical protein
MTLSAEQFEQGLNPEEHMAKLRHQLLWMYFRFDATMYCQLCAKKRYNLARCRLYAMSGSPSCSYCKRRRGYRRVKIGG